MTNLIIRPTSGQKNVFRPTGGRVGVKSRSSYISGWRLNEPGGLTMRGELDFSQTVPAGGGNERFIPGTSNNWSVIADSDVEPASDPGSGSLFEKISDPTAIRSPNDVWRQTAPSGTWAEGHTFGRIHLYGLGSVSTVYICHAVMWDPEFEENTVSTKYLALEPGNLLLQYRLSSRFLRVSSETIGQDYDTRMLVTTRPTLGVWHIIEWLAIKGNPGTIKVWDNGVLCTDSTDLPVANSTGNFTECYYSGHLGGGGMTKVRDSYVYHDELYVSAS